MSSTNIIVYALGFRSFELLHSSYLKVGADTFIITKFLVQRLKMYQRPDNTREFLDILRYSSINLTRASFQTLQSAIHLILHCILHNAYIFA